MGNEEAKGKKDTKWCAACGVEKKHADFPRTTKRNSKNELKLDADGKRILTVTGHYCLQCIRERDDLVKLCPMCSQIKPIRDFRLNPQRSFEYCLLCSRTKDSLYHRAKHTAARLDETRERLALETDERKRKEYAENIELAVAYLERKKNRKERK